jgi:NADPH2:quinone reductase
LSKKNVKLVRQTLPDYIKQREEFHARAEQPLNLVSGGSFKEPEGGEYSLDSVCTDLTS